MEMHALFIVLNDKYLIDDIHDILSESGVGGTMFESTGLGKVGMNYQDSDHHTFTSLQKMLKGARPENVTIMSVIKEDDKLDEVTIKIMKLLNNIEEKGVGFMFVVPVHEIFGYKGKTVR